MPLWLLYSSLHRKSGGGSFSLTPNPSFLPYPVCSLSYAPSIFVSISWDIHTPVRYEALYRHRLLSVRSWLLLSLFYRGRLKTLPMPLEILPEMSESLLSRRLPHGLCPRRIRAACSAPSPFLYSLIPPRQRINPPKVQRSPLLCAYGITHE